FAAEAPIWNLTRSVTATALNMESETTCVPGPLRIPTPDVGQRPTLFGGTANALLLIQLEILRLDGYSGTPETISARPLPTSVENPVPDGSAPGTVTLRNGPL